MKLYVAALRRFLSASFQMMVVMSRREAFVLISVLISALNVSLVLCYKTNQNQNANSLPLTSGNQHHHPTSAGHGETGELENCGIIPPSVKHYIYGGKQSMIEQWPWQVSTYGFL